jgi:hypothetical protein
MAEWVVQQKKSEHRATAPEARNVRIHAEPEFLGRLPRLESRSPLEPSRSSRCGLFARRAGVHIDLHAYRHFGNFRSFPGHSEPPMDFYA